MKMKYMMLAASLLGVGLVVGTGCDWSSGGDSLNTSQGAGVNINFSGVYNGNISGRAVDRTSAGAIASLTIRQSGNRVEVTDSQGSHYAGSVGSPGVVSTAGSEGTYPSGAQLVQAQISWAGKDGVAQRDVEFVGVIHAVTVDDIKGSQQVKTSTATDSSSSSSGSAATSTKTETVNNGPTSTSTKTEIFGTLGSPYYEEIITVTVSNNTTGQVISQTTTKNSDNSKAKNNEVITQTINTYVMTEANIQYRLEGTWIEKDSPIVSRVDAVSRGTYGVITISTGGAQELLPPTTSTLAPTTVTPGTGSSSSSGSSGSTP